MAAGFTQLIIWLVAGIVVIVLLTAKYHIHAFFALLIACFVVGLGVQMPFEDILNAVKDGFGNIMRSLALIIVLGTTLGVLLEHTGSTKVMANFILKMVGEKNASLALSLTGFIVGMPIFCDSGFIVLSGINKSVAKRAGISVVITSVALSTGLYAVHCLMPPHPGAASAAGIINVDFGKLILTGIIAALPAMIIGNIWARFAGKKTNFIEAEEEIVTAAAKPPSVMQAFLPVVIPIVLIALKSFFALEGDETNIAQIFSILGEPAIALAAGVLLAFNCSRAWTKTIVSKQLQEAAEKAGGILVIIGAGGAFGAVLAATKIGEHFSSVLPLGSLGILFPFLITFILKTAQGSSTVAIITAASIVQPLLPALGLQSDTDRLLCVLSMGAGSMMISHANDAYFWVIAKFSGIEMKSMLKVYSIATAFMGLITLLTIYLLSFII
ncbi:GntP family permease [Parafilimonas terrae]|jgi:GntP family gluconate:H+ symporter|uniref:Predicted D-glycerate permease n=1 Tax=Parafilimonas terrae TaxID=1465490 RepID=A0A1I5VAY7_9BACT|nr:GntP family permease [Parafilimonas terrae]SFQ04096.1 predicted D-glycerate permease [Parafilimonas terrae]